MPVRFSDGVCTQRLPGLNTTSKVDRCGWPSAVSCPEYYGDNAWRYNGNEKRLPLGSSGTLYLRFSSAFSRRFTPAMDECIFKIFCNCPDVTRRLLRAPAALGSSNQGLRMHQDQPSSVAGLRLNYESERAKNP